MHRLLSVLLVFGLVGALGNTALAQSQVGRAVVDGRTVVLLADGTWRFEDEATNKDCQFSSGPVEFCGSAMTWRTMPDSGNPDIDAFYQYSERLFAMIILEGLGRNAGIDEEAFQSITLTNFASRTGTTAEDVPVLSVEDGELSGQDVRTLAYSGSVDGLPLVFANTLLLLDGHNAQFITYSIGQEFTEEHQNLHAQFLSDITIRPEE